jgi:predicted aminopeptidase
MSLYQSFLKYLKLKNVLYRGALKLFLIIIIDIPYFEVTALQILNYLLHSKKALLLILILLLLTGASIWFRSTIKYVITQGTGQLKILMNRQPISEYIARETTTSEELEKLKIIEEAIDFAVNQIGLTDNGAYRTIYDQKNRPLLYLVTAAPEFSLTSYRWKFPIAGSFSYLGFFKLKNAKVEAECLQNMGYDTRIRTVSAWSTLGYFKDPVFTGMLKRSEGSLVNLIIHEMTHGTIFVKNNMQFNENIATFTGDMGTIIFYEKKYGKNSPQLKKYLQQEEDSKIFSDHILNGAVQLKKLYSSSSEATTVQKKREQKQQLIIEIMESVRDLPIHYPDKYKGYHEFRPNNAWFTGYLTYRADLTELHKQLQNEFDGDLASFITVLKERSVELKTASNH